MPFRENPYDVFASVTFAPDGATLGTGGKRKIKLCDVAMRTSIEILREATGPVRDVAFSPDGTTMACGTADGTVRLWDVAARVQRSVLPQIRH